MTCTAILAIICALLVAAPVSATPRSDRERDKLLDAALTKQYGSKGPSSTSSSRGFYQGSNGSWRRR